MEDWTDLAKIVLGAMLALISGITTQVFIARQSDLSQRIDELIKIIWEYAEISSRYWAGQIEQNEQSLAEAKIVALDFFIGKLISTLATEKETPEDWKPVEECLETLANTVTGGNFQVRGRNNEVERATLIYSSASQLCVILRSHRRRLFALPFNSFLRSE